MSMTIPEQCIRCKHYRPDQPGMECDAYPVFPGIPHPILDGVHDHREPFAGDRGVRWEPIKLGAKHPLDDRGK